MLDCDIAIMHKDRPKHNQAEITALIGNVHGKVCILNDDMIDTAGSLVAAATTLKAKGAEKVYACATHGPVSYTHLDVYKRQGLAFGFASGAATGDAAAIFWVALVCGGLAPLVCGWLARSKPASAVTMATVAFAGGIIGSIAFRAVMWMVGTAVANYFGIVL